MPARAKAKAIEYLTARELGDPLDPTEAGFVLALELCRRDGLTLSEVTAALGYADQSAASRLLARLQERVAPTALQSRPTDKPGAYKEWYLAPGQCS